jgi:hypothetical protein
MWEVWNKESILILISPWNRTTPPNISSAATRGAVMEAEVRVIGPGMGENSKRRVAF